MNFRNAKTKVGALNGRQVSDGQQGCGQAMLETSKKATDALSRGAVTVLPRLQAEAVTPVEAAVCISITNPRQSPAHLEGWSQILRLGFHDVDYSIGSYKAMTVAQAGELLDFVHQHRQNPLMVHCEAGFSRSVAAGRFIAAWLDRELSVPVIGPNPGVTLVLCKAGWLRALKWRDWRLLKLALFGPAYFEKPNAILMRNWS